MSEVKKELLAVVLEAIDLEKLAIGLIEDVAEKELAAALAGKGLAPEMIALILPAVNPAIEKAIHEKVVALKAKLQA